MNVLTHLKKLQEEIQKSVEKAHRSLEEIHLVVATKTIPWDQMNLLYQAGLRDFGESRIQEALTKIPKAPHDVRWHFIGHLQSNKVAKTLRHFSLIHSVDSIELARHLSKASVEAHIKTSLLLQANASQEISKKGLSPSEWKKNFNELLSLEGIEIKGLMTMAPLTEDETIIRHTFSALRFLRDELRLLTEDKTSLPYLSMGMTRDFRIAIEEGATHLRIGTALFQRPYE